MAAEQRVIHGLGFCDQCSPRFGGARVTVTLSDAGGYTCDVCGFAVRDERVATCEAVRPLTPARRRIMQTEAVVDAARAWYEARLQTAHDQRVPAWTFAAVRDQLANRLRLRATEARLERAIEELDR